MASRKLLLCAAVAAYVFLWSWSALGRVPRGKLPTCDQLSFYASKEFQEAAFFTCIDEGMKRVCDVRGRKVDTDDCLKAVGKICREALSEFNQDLALMKRRLSCK
jgi:hypothetical protein